MWKRVGGGARLSNSNNNNQICVFPKWRLRIFSCHFTFFPILFFLTFALTKKSRVRRRGTPSPRPWPCASARNHDLSDSRLAHVCSMATTPTTLRHCQYTAQHGPFTVVCSKSGTIRSIWTRGLKSMYTEFKLE